MNAENPSEPELASLYAIGALTAEERAAFEASLDGGAEAELHRFNHVIEALTGALPPLAPDPAVRERLMARIAAQARSRPAAIEPAPIGPGHPLPDWFIQRDSNEAWEETGHPGVRIRRLFLDRGRNECTALVRMAAGSSYPAHIHGGPEECLVLDGDLRCGDLVLRAWDYQHAGPGTIHGGLTSHQGCLMLIRSSLENQWKG
jgi:anti-sigma factor ChrR (cupin superfamily)